MKKRGKQILFLAVVILCFFLTSCFPFGGLFDHRFIRIQPTVTNLEMINTEYDDFNAVGPPMYFGRQDLLYASNAFSQGACFDILHSRIDLSVLWVEGRGETSVYNFSLEATPGVPFMELISSPYDEYGPYLFPDEDQWNVYSAEVLSDRFVYLMASNRPSNDSDSFNIYYFTADDGLQHFAGNSQANDYYPSYHRESRTLYFCSDRDGSFNIFSYWHEDTNGLQQLLGTRVEPEAIWWSDCSANDKTPFIYKDIMVFASDRGGTFDIYFSEWEEGVWSSPRVLPNQIEQHNDDPFHYLNTNHNEYRPFLFGADSFRTDENLLMIFSSDRPGGKGGYDLYLAVLPLDIFH